MSSDFQTRLIEAEKSFKKACDQIIQLNRRLDEMAKRYEKASRENHRSFRYSLRLRMAVTEGVRNMYYEYAANKADEINNLRCHVLRDSSDGSQALASVDVVDGNERGEEEEGGAGESNPIADLEEVGDMLDNRLLNDSGPGYSGSAMQEEGDNTSDNDTQEETLVLDQEMEAMEASDNHDLTIPTLVVPDIETTEEEEEDMVEVSPHRYHDRLTISVPSLSASTSSHLGSS